MKYKEQAQVRADLAALVARLEEGNVLLANPYLMSLRRSGTGCAAANRQVWLVAEALRKGFRSTALYHAKLARQLFKEGEK